jgi:hypothetical protein
VVDATELMSKEPAHAGPAFLDGVFHLFTPVRQYERFGNRALSGLSEGPDSLIKRPNFKIIYNFLIKHKGQILIK